MDRFVYDRFNAGNRKPLAFLAELQRAGVDLADFGDRLPRPADLHTHPDVYSRVWSEIAAALPEDGRTLAFRRAVLQHPPTGLLLAIAFGTYYVVRVPREVNQQLESDERAFVRINSNDSRRIDLRNDVGSNWVFGGTGLTNWIGAELRMSWRPPRRESDRRAVAPTIRQGRAVPATRSVCRSVGNAVLGARFEVDCDGA